MFDPLLFLERVKVDTFGLVCRWIAQILANEISTTP